MNTFQTRVLDALRTAARTLPELLELLGAAGRPGPAAAIRANVRDMLHRGTIVRRGDLLATE